MLCLLSVSWQPVRSNGTTEAGIGASRQRLKRSEATPCRFSGGLVFNPRSQHRPQLRCSGAHGQPHSLKREDRCTDCLQLAITGLHWLDRG